MQIWPPRRLTRENERETGRRIARRCGVLATARPALVAALVLGWSSMARAEIVPPEPLDEPIAEWPGRHAQTNDLLVPVVLVVGADGSVRESSLEAGVGEPFDAAALARARQLRFEPARNEKGPISARIRLLVRFPARAGIARELPTSGSGEVQSELMSRAEQPQKAPLEPTAPEQKQPEPPSPAGVTVQGVVPPRSASDVVVEERVLRAAPHKNASELLSVVPGVFISQHSGEGKAHQIFFRGFDAVHGQDVELWAAGAPVNDVSNIHGQGYADLHFLIPEVVQEIRSTPGTYDPRQGDFAVAGSMRFSLGYTEPGVSAKASLGSFGTRRYFLGYHPKSAPAGTFGAFELYGTDGFGPSRAARRVSGMGQAVFALGSDVSARVMASTYAGRFDSAGVLPLRDIETGVVDRFGTYDPKQGGASSRTQLVLELANEARERETESAHKWSIAPYAVFRSLKLRSNYTGTLTSTEGDSIQQLNDAVTLGAVASYRRAVELVSKHDSLEAGISLRADSIRQSQHRTSTLTDAISDDASSPGIAGNVRATNAAGYIDVSLHPLRRVTLRGGLRADGLSYSNENTREAASGPARSAMGGQLSKRATLDVAVMPGLHAVASYGEGFRSPQARSLGDGETTPFTRVVSYEAGLRFRDDKRLQSSLALFQTRLSDDLVFDQSTARNELVPSTRRTGLAVNLLAQPTNWLVSSTSFSYTHAAFSRGNERYRSGDLLPYVPQVVVRSDLAVSPVLGRFLNRELQSHFGVGLSYFGRRPLPYAEMGHDAFLVDARAELRLGAVQTGLELFNALDANWYDGEFVYASRFGSAASLVPSRHVTVGPPRTLLWSLALFI